MSKQTIFTIILAIALLAICVHFYIRVEELIVENSRPIYQPVFIGSLEVQVELVENQFNVGSVEGNGITIGNNNGVTNSFG